MLIEASALEKCSIGALCKFMCVSQAFCNENIKLLFDLLASRIDPRVKSTIIVCLGDLCNRFPNIMVQNNSDIFRLLHDKESHVRKNALMVISHLNLNDMLKLKGEIVDICMLVEDPEPQIRELVKLFLFEINNKDSSCIYNLIPKAISRLSKEFQGLTADKFQMIAKTLLSYVEKDKQIESLIDRMCEKMKGAQSAIEARNLVFSLSQLKFSEKGALKMREKIECYKGLLLEPELKPIFQMIAQTVKRNPQIKAEIKEEFERIMNADEQTLM